MEIRKRNPEVQEDVKRLAGMGAGRSKAEGIGTWRDQFLAPAQDDERVAGVAARVRGFMTVWVLL